MKKISIAIVALFLVYGMYFLGNNYQSTKHEGITLEIKQKLILCGKDYTNFTIDLFIPSDIVKISPDRVLYKGVLDNTTYAVYVVDGCTGEKHLVLSDAAEKTNQSFINNTFYILKNRYVVSLVDMALYQQDYNAIYYIDLGTTKDFFTYKKLPLGMQSNETIFHYEKFCGDGCDKETRTFFATTTKDALIISIFDKNVKEIQNISGVEIEVRKKIREIIVKESDLK